MTDTNTEPAKPNNDAEPVVEPKDVKDDQLPEDGMVVDDKAPEPKADPKADDTKDDKPVDDSDDADKDVEYELKLSKDSLMDSSRVDEIVAEAKEQGLSVEDAQDALEREEAVITRFADEKKAEVESIRKDWKKEVKNDKELGGDNLAKTMANTKLAIDTFGDDNFKKILEETGFGDHPAFMRAFNEIGKVMQDDSLVHADSVGGGKKKMFKHLDEN